MAEYGKFQNLLHTPEGVRDLYEDELAAKKDTISAILQKMNLYGYRELETPTFEFFDIYAGEIGTTPSRSLFKFFDQDGSTVVLRPDFTPAVARCAAKYYREEKNPIRFCYKGNVFSNTNNLQGKLKESTQMGVEFMGDSSVYADAECIALLVESLCAVGLTEFQVCLGNADYFRGLCASASLDEETEFALREQISGRNYIAAERLLEKAGVSEAAAQRFLKVSDLIGKEEALIAAEENADNERSLLALKRLRDVYAVLKEYGVQEHISFDLAMLSKYNYYTGIIFKGFTYGVGDVIAAGGRYDNLIAKFGKPAAAVGFMIPVDVLMEALKAQKITTSQNEQPEQVFYNKDNYEEKLREVIEMRRNGMSVTLSPEAAEE